MRRKRTQRMNRHYTASVYTEDGVFLASGTGEHKKGAKTASGRIAVAKFALIDPNARLALKGLLRKSLQSRFT